MKTHKKENPPTPKLNSTRRDPAHDQDRFTLNKNKRNGERDPVSAYKRTKTSKRFITTKEGASPKENKGDYKSSSSSSKGLSGGARKKKHQPRNDEGKKTNLSP